MLFISVALFFQYTLSTKLSLAVVRPFSKKDYHKLKLSLHEWNSFLPCEMPTENLYDLHLVYSQDLENGYGKEVVRPYIEEVVNSFYNKEELWMQCFKNVTYHDSKIDPALDIYNPKAYNRDRMWVNGPNSQFLDINRYIESFNYDAWFLMEFDSVPIRAYFLDALAGEIEQTRPFAILGSTYRGDRWDLMMTEVHPSLKNHINGNAVYNSSHPKMRFLINRLEEDHHTDDRSVPFDYRISQIIYEHGYDNSYYNGRSDVIGNYAATNMIPELFGNEYIVHGARIYNKWQSDTVKIGMVVSDWGLGNLQIFHESVLNGDHPFSEIVYVVPSHVLPEKQEVIVKGINGDILIRYVGRNTNRVNNPDYLDICYHQPRTTDYFMYSNTYMKIASPVHIIIDKKTMAPVVNYVSAESQTCMESDTCYDTINNVRNHIDYNISYLVQDMTMIYNKNLIGSLLTKKSGYCSVWLQSYNGEQASSCEPDNVPSATGYVAYLHYISMQHQYSFSSVIDHGSRDVVVPHTIPPTEERRCKLIRKRHADTAATYIATIRKSRDVLPLALIKCINITDNRELCESLPHCWWRPKFDKCIQVKEVTDTYETQYFVKPRSATEEIKYSNGCPDCPVCPMFKDDNKMGSGDVSAIVLGALLLTTLSILGMIAALLAWWCCSLGRTSTSLYPTLAATQLFTSVIEPVTFVEQAPVIVPQQMQQIETITEHDPPPHVFFHNAQEVVTTIAPDPPGVSMPPPGSFPSPQGGWLPSMAPYPPYGTGAII